MSKIRIAIAAAVVVFLLVLLVSSPEDDEEVTSPPKKTIQTRIPDFGSYKDVKEKKIAFFEFMIPLVRNANENVSKERATLFAITRSFQDTGSLTTSEQKTFESLAKKYRVKAEKLETSESLAQLLRRVDVVPASLILAQSANESAWGTSRFARKAYNFFGIWCFVPGCGLTPRLRPDGLSHEVAKFETVQDGVDYYLWTINTNHAYQELRRIRKDLRQEEISVTGNALAEGLTRYSERGADYVDEIQAMIRINKLSSYTLDSIADPNTGGD